MKGKSMPRTNPLDRFNCGPVTFSGGSDALYERHLTFDQVIPVAAATPRDKFEAVARSVRDLLSQRWIKTEQTYQARNVKRVYYLSLEFLMGRSLANNITNLLLDPVWSQFCKKHKIDPLEIIEQEPDAGLGNGGLGRLAACFLDSMATLGIPGMGSGLRYEYGIFKQTVRDGWQHEQPDHWLARPDPWEVARPDEAVEVRLACSFDIHAGALRIVQDRPSTLIGIPYDRPVVGYGGRTINTLRLWSAATPDYFDFQQFSGGDFVGALAETLTAETLTRVLYPDDSTAEGKGLRFLQQYFLVACTLADAIRRFRAAGNDWSALPDKVAMQLNDTHPTLAVPELMRILLDEAKLGWDEAWDLTQRTLAYTNHTLLPEALEKWPLPWFEMMLPRQLEIIYEINRRFLDDVRTPFPRRRRTGRAREPDRGGPAEEDPHGAPRHRRLAQHQRRGGDSLGAAQANRGARLRRALPRPIQQQDQRRHAAALSPARESAARHGDHRRHRRRLDRRSRPAAEARAAGRRQGVPRRDSQGQARGQGAVRRLAQVRHRTGGRPRVDLRYAHQAHPRVQAAAPERAPHRRALQPPAREPDARRAAAHVLLRRQGGARVPLRQAGHQVHQQPRCDHRRRPGDAAGA